jgi:hypothetical protein
LVNFVDELLSGFQLGHLGLRFTFELGQRDLSFLSAGVVVLFLGHYLPERIHFVLNCLLLRLDFLLGLIFVVDQFLGFFI